MISLSYSRISLEDIAEKLKLDSSVDAEYIVAKVSESIGVAEIAKGVWPKFVKWVWLYLY